MKTFYIHVPTPEISEIVQKQLFKLGYKWNDSQKSVSHTERKVLNIYSDYGEIFWTSENDSKTGQELTINELFLSFPARRSNVIFPPGEIVPDYPVTIKEKGITVGCQTVSFEAFEKLAGAVENYLMGTKAPPGTPS